MANIPVENPAANNAAFVALAAAVAPRLVFSRINMNNANFSASFRDDGTGKLGWYVGGSGAADGAQINALSVDPATGQLTLTQTLTAQAINALSIGRLGANPFSIRTDGVDRITVSAAGLVGLGTTSPGDLLHVAAAAAPTGTTRYTMRLTTTGAQYGAAFTGYIEQGVGPGAVISTINNGVVTDRIVITGTAVTFPTGMTIPSNATATTQAQGDNSTKPATTAYVDTAAAGSGLAIGSTIMYDGLDATLPNALEQNGAGYSSVTYNPLFSKLVKTATVTISIASPGVITWTGHGLRVGYPIKFKTTGALPTGLTAGTTYWIISAGFGVNSFQISATPGGSAISTSGTQSGVHDAACAPHGISNDFLTFNVPDMRGIFVRGFDDGRGIDTGRGHGQEQLDAMQGHRHVTSVPNAQVTSNYTVDGVGLAGEALVTSGNPVTDGVNGTPRTAAETRPRNNTKRFFIKYQ